MCWISDLFANTPVMLDPAAFNDPMPLDDDDPRGRNGKVCESLASWVCFSIESGLNERDCRNEDGNLGFCDWCDGRIAISFPASIRLPLLCASQLSKSTACDGSMEIADRDVLPASQATALPT